MRRRFSYSMLSLRNCQGAIKYYIDRAPVPGGVVSPALLRGNKLHKAIELTLLDGDWDPESIFTMVDRGDNETEKEYRLTRDELTLYYSILPEVENIRDRLYFPPEKKLEIDKDGGEFVCVLDAYTNCGTIVDWKFPNRPWDEGKLKHYTELQSWLYFYLLADYNPHQMEFVVCDEQYGRVEVFVVQNEPKIVEEKSHEWLNLISQIRHADETDSWEFNPSPYNCRYCNYKVICPHSS